MMLRRTILRVTDCVFYVLNFVLIIVFVPLLFIALGLAVLILTALYNIFGPGAECEGNWLKRYQNK